MTATTTRDVASGEPSAIPETRAAMLQWLRETLCSPACAAALASVLRDPAHPHHKRIVRDLERRGVKIIRLSPEEYTRLRESGHAPPADEVARST